MSRSEVITTSTQDLAKKLITQIKGADARTFGIDISCQDSDVTFKWLIAAILLGRCLSRQQALTQFKMIELAGLITPDAISSAGLSGVYAILKGNTSWDATRVDSLLVEVANTLIVNYEGDLNRLHFFADSAEDLERKLCLLSCRLPLKTVHTFLKGVRGLWEKADPPFSPASRMAYTVLFSKYFGEYESPADLKRHLEEGCFGDIAPSAFEAALEQLGERYCQGLHCAACPFRKECTVNQSK